MCVLLQTSNRVLLDSAVLLPMIHRVSIRAWLPAWVRANLGACIMRACTRLHVTVYLQHARQGVRVASRDFPKLVSCRGGGADWTSTALEVYTSSKLGDNLGLVIVRIAQEFESRVASFELDIDEEVVPGTVTCHY